VEILEEYQELLLVPPQDALDLRWLFRICNKDLCLDSIPVSIQLDTPYLEHMERLKLDVLTLVSEHIHHHLQVGLAGDIPGHNIEIRPVKQDLSEELKRLSLGYVVLRQDEGSVRSEEAIIVLFEVLRHHWFVTR
jgi:hypothetical protein